MNAPSKYDLAQYLVNLNTLISAQSATGVNGSETLGAEYQRGWKLLKDMIRKDEQNETRKS